MSTAAAQSLRQNFVHAWGLLEQFIKVCPEHIWVQTFGGWPIWQTVYHALVTIEFFVRQKGDPRYDLPCSREAGSLNEVHTGPAVSREEMLRMHGDLKAVALSYMDGLTDAGLGELNEGLSARMPSPFTHAATCSLLAGHTLYHLGTCDAALRQEGLKGVF
jgi:hypothetical protein